MRTVYKERQLLRKLIKASNKYPNDIIPTSELPVKEDDYYFKQLLKHELICVEETEEVAPLQLEYVSYAITDKGKHFFEYRHEGLQNQLLKSVYLPIIVAFVTTCITLALNHWLPRLLGWK